MEKLLRKVRQYRFEILTGAGLIFFFIFLRTVRVNLVPIFVDEAIYLRWAQIAKNDASWRFISLTDGKQPLFIWLVMISMKIISDPLIAGRIVSAVSGLLTMLSIWILTWILFKNRPAAFLASFLYAIIPFYLLHDRMALMDSLVGTFSIWALILEVLLVKTIRLDVALILGAVLGGGALTKSSGFISLYLLPLSLLLFNWKNKHWKFRLLNWVALAFLAAIISQAFYSILRLSPFFHIIAEKNNLFVYPFTEWLKHPLQFLVGNLRGMVNWLIGYLGLPVIILVFASLVFGLERAKEKLLLFLWFLVPFFALGLFGKTLYPRFILFMTLPLLVLAGILLAKIVAKLKRNWLLVPALIIIFFNLFYIDYCLFSKPAMAKIPDHDRRQYLISWPVGYGVNEIVAYLKSRAQKEKIFVATEGNFGLLPASLELYLWNNPNIEIKGYWPVKEIPAEVLEKTKFKPVFFVFNETQEIQNQWPLKLIACYPRPDPSYSMRLFQVENQQ